MSSGSSSSPSKSPEAVSLLNNLIDTCKNGEEGFRLAAENVEDQKLKTLFNQFSQQRSQFVSELQSCVEKLGGNPDDSGTIAGMAHRGWINLKSAVTGHDAHAIIAECERGEDHAVDVYQDALKADLPQQVSSIVERQFSEVKAAHDRIASLDRTTGK
jgi:uncharacterized protein (TIGR02284 family)